MQPSVTQTSCDAVHLLLLAAVLLQWHAGCRCGARRPPRVELLLLPPVRGQLLWVPRLRLQVIPVLLMDRQTVLWLLHVRRQAAGAQQLAKLLHGVVGWGSLATP